MRLDQLLPTLGIIKRRTVVKELADNGLIEVNGQRAKPSRAIAAGDTISVRGSKPLTVKILALPTGSVRKERREEYYQTLAADSAGHN